MKTSKFLGPWGTAGVLILSVVIFGLPLFANAGDVIFETTLPWYYSWGNINWGRNSFTYVDRVSINYTPSSDEVVCTIKPGLYKSGNPTDDVVLTVKGGGNGYPEGGQVIGTSTISASQVANPPVIGNQSTYTSFSFAPCLNFTAGTNYSFILSRSQPDFNNLYVLQFSNFIVHPQTSVWSYVPVNSFWQQATNYEPALRLEGPDKKEPVIIVPGILGSRLNRASDGEEVWPSIGRMAIPGPDDYLDEIKLNSDSSEITDINSTEIIESVLSFNQYGALIQKFKDNGYELGRDLLIMPYDWRLDIEISSMELDSIVDTAIVNSPTGKVNIVAHSMGGLLTKDYLIRNGESRISKVIFAGTPHLGAPKAFNLLNWGDDFDLRFLGLGLNKNKAKEIGQNMPAVYQLLPSREYLNGAGNYVNDLDYDGTNQLMISDGRNENILNLADNFHQSHDSWLPENANVYNLLGCREYETIGSFDIESNGSVDINTITGDGTVPLVSAEHIPGNNYYVPYPQTKINHMGLVSDERTISLIHQIITDSVSELPAGISKEKSDCENIGEEVRRLRFSTHSPVNLHVYDSLGNHTGLTPEGNIEMNIPDSNFVQVGENNFVFVPDGVYLVRIEAYDTGSFDFQVKELINGNVKNSTIYDNIPIEDSNLEANFKENVLNVDRNGDNIIDAGYSPDGSWIPYNATIESTILDLERIYQLGWTVGEVKNSLQSLLKASLPTAETILSKGKKANGLLGTAFLNQLETEYNKGKINQKAYNIIKSNILFLLGSL